jgi:AcrR family transcriptional regulator
MSNTNNSEINRSSPRKKRKINIFKNLILEAASDLFNKKPFDLVSMEEIADKVAMSRATIYNYFSSKEEIFFQIGIQFCSKFFSDYEKLTYDVSSSLDRFLIFNRLLLTSFYDTPVAHKIYQRFLQVISLESQEILYETIEDLALNDKKVSKVIGDLKIKIYVKELLSNIIKMSKITKQLIVNAKKDKLIKESLEMRDVYSLSLIITDGYGYGLGPYNNRLRAGGDKIVYYSIEMLEKTIRKD